MRNTVDIVPRDVVGHFRTVCYSIFKRSYIPNRILIHFKIFPSLTLCNFVKL